MKLGERLVEVFAGKIIKEKVDERIKETTIPSGDRKEDELWRAITQGKRDLTPITQDRMIEIAFWLYDKNGMAHRIIEMVKDFVIGEGVEIIAPNPNVKKILTEFWHHSVNNFELKQFDRVKELGIFGEQFYPVFVNDTNGFVQLGNLDPSLIEDIIKNKENIEELEKVKTKDNEDGTPGKVYDVIRMGRGAEDFGKYIGDCFVFQINKVSTAKRGRSDLFSVADWLDGYERFLFNRLEASHLKNSFVYDILLEGLNQKQIDAWLDKQQIPRPGSFRAHNEKVKWTMETAKFDAQDASNEGKLLRTHLLGQVGLPPHWFAGGEGVTRATALAMGTPVFAMLRSRQRFIKYMFTQILDYVIFQAVEHQQLTKEEDKTFVLVFPKLIEKDFVELSTAISGLSNALVVLAGEGYLSTETAKKATVYLFSQLGIDVSETEQQKVVKEKEERTKEELEKIKNYRRGKLGDIVSKAKTAESED